MDPRIFCGASKNTTTLWSVTDSSEASVIRCPCAGLLPDQCEIRRRLCGWRGLATLRLITTAQPEVCWCAAASPGAAGARCRRLRTACAGSMTFDPEKHDQVGPGYLSRVRPGRITG
jgi:hypothetical protein